ncbi:FkbM family methyltransferase [Parasphingopyxis sp.]|uniref:FkbM family methyltransferase n=1 Tax=Parasphingopyxis sp. TaxID=1920299 RepID=UPI00261A6AF8|nr:FkbM family methyltransferase [Parasphingopyxis sp.]
MSDTEEQEPGLTDPNIGARPQQLFGLAMLKKFEDIATVFDIGVFRGTPELYTVFTESKFVLVDPIKNDRIHALDPPENSIFVNKALGAQPGSMLLHEMGPKTGFVERTKLSQGVLRDEYDVEVVTLDSLIEQYAPTGWIGLKIDTEGFEEQIIKGLNEHAHRISFVICEASIRKRFIGGYVFSELVAAMHERGLEFFNIIGKLKRRPTYYDVVFLRRDHPLFD